MENRDKHFKGNNNARTIRIDTNTPAFVAELERRHEVTSGGTSPGGFVRNPYAESDQGHTFADSESRITLTLPSSAPTVTHFLRESDEPVVDVEELIPESPSEPTNTQHTGVSPWGVRKSVWFVVALSLLLVATLVAVHKKTSSPSHETVPDDTVVASSPKVPALPTQRTVSQLPEGLFNPPDDPHASVLPTRLYEYRTQTHHSSGPPKTIARAERSRESVVGSSGAVVVVTSPTRFHEVQSVVERLERQAPPVGVSLVVFLGNAEEPTTPASWASILRPHSLAVSPRRVVSLRDPGAYDPSVFSGAHSRIRIERAGGTLVQNYSPTQADVVGSVTGQVFDRFAPAPYLPVVVAPVFVQQPEETGAKPVRPVVAERDQGETTETSTPEPPQETELRYADTSKDPPGVNDAATAVDNSSDTAETASQTQPPATPDSATQDSTQPTVQLGVEVNSNPIPSPTPDSTGSPQPGTAPEGLPPQGHRPDIKPEPTPPAADPDGRSDTQEPTKSPEVQAPITPQTRPVQPAAPVQLNTWIKAAESFPLPL